MRDYFYDPQDGGPPIAVADLHSPDIRGLLLGAIELTPEDNTPVANVRERLQLELHIRSLGLSVK